MRPLLSRNMPQGFHGGGFKAFQRFVGSVYGPPDDRWFDVADLVTNTHRFTARALKNIRQGDFQIAAFHIALAQSWLASIANRLDLNLDLVVWSNFAYRCPYCCGCPCCCPGHGDAARLPRPAAIAEYQFMFAQIYPQSKGSLVRAASHMAEEMGELAEAVMIYRTGHTHEGLERVALETADYVSCALGVFNALGATIDLPETELEWTLQTVFCDGCHVCHCLPCTCEYEFVMAYGEDPSRRRRC